MFFFLLNDFPFFFFVCVFSMDNGEDPPEDPPEGEWGTRQTKSGG